MLIYLSKLRFSLARPPRTSVFLEVPYTNGGKKAGRAGDDIRECILRKNVLIVRGPLPGIRNFCSPKAIDVGASTLHPRSNLFHFEIFVNGIFLVKVTGNRHKTYQLFRFVSGRSPKFHEYFVIFSLDDSVFR